MKHDQITPVRLRPAFDRFCKPIGASLAVFTLAAPVAVQAQTLETASARTEIAPEVTLTHIRDMDFGRLIVPNAGRVDMSAEETPTCVPNNGIAVLDACQSAMFSGTAAELFQVRISVPVGRQIELTGPGVDLRLRQMTVGAGDGLTFNGRTNRHFDFTVTDPAGEFDFYVGARLRFRNNQAPGVYTGTFTIEADYQ